MHHVGAVLFRCPSVHPVDIVQTLEFLGRHNATLWQHFMVISSVTGMVSRLEIFCCGHSTNMVIDGMLIRWNNWPSDFQYLHCIKLSWQNTFTWDCKIFNHFWRSSCVWEEYQKMPSLFCLFDIVIFSASTKMKGGYTGFTLSICSFVRLWTESCQLCIFHNTSRIYFIFAHFINQLHEVCRLLRFLKIWFLAISLKL